MEQEIIERASQIAKTIEKLYRQLLKKEVKNEDIKNTGLSTLFCTN